MSRNQKFVRFSRYCILFFAISFFGWLWETAYFYVISQQFIDRGFLRIPICPIYGFCIIGVYFLLGTPNKGRGLLKKTTNPKQLFWLYLLMAALIPTIVEYVTAWIFDYFLGMTLWSYAGNFLNVNGYVCLSVSVFWGVSITLLMKYLFPKLQMLLDKIPNLFAEISAAVLLCFLGFDFVHCLCKAL